MKLIDRLFVWRQWDSDEWWELSTFAFGMLIGQALFWASIGIVDPTLYAFTFLLSQAALRGHHFALDRERAELAEQTPTETGLIADSDGSYRVH